MKQVLDPNTVRFTEVYYHEGWFYFDAILPDGTHIQSSEYSYKINAQEDLDFVKNSVCEIHKFIEDFQ